MLKRLLIGFMITSGLLLVVHAQEATPEPTPPREIYTVLGWGDDVFEPITWYASAEELPDRTRATWRAQSIGGLAYADYIHFEEGINVRQIDDVFNTAWFEVALGRTYDVWRENRRCDLANLRLIEFSLQTGDTKYNMHYWIEWVDQYRVMAIFIVLPASTPERMDFYAQKLYPELPSCSEAIT